MPLRALPDGVMFVLLRTGERYRLVGRQKVKGRTRINVASLSPRISHGCLNHQCMVVPIIKPRVRLKNGN